MNKDKNSYSFNRNFMYGMMYIRQKIDKNTSKKSIDGYNLKLLNLNMFPNECNELVEEAAFFILKVAELLRKYLKYMILILIIMKKYYIMEMKRKID